LSLKLLIDEDSQAKLLVLFLKRAGHDVLTPNEVGLGGFSDDVVLDYGRSQNRLILTHNCDDFELLHEVNPNHPGIMVIYRDANRATNMDYKAIVRAISNLEAANVPLANQFISLNQWNY
jgi:predicted nuclease of predicted toxin-antitoxin system